MKIYKQIIANEVNPKLSRWYDTSGGRLYWFNNETCWSCREDIVSEEYPKFWYEAVLIDNKPVEVSDRFQLPTNKQMIEIAILFNEGGLDLDKLADIVGYGQFIVDRLYENGDVSKPSLKEGE